MIALIYFVAIICGANAQNQEFVLNSNWTLSSQHLNITIPNLTLPTSVHTALRSQNHIGDPLYRFSDVNLTWIFENDDWIMTNSFKIDKFSKLNISTTINFVFDAIDTIASVYLNEKFILHANNQFMRYQVDNLNSKLNEDTNLLEVKFSSPTKVASSLAYMYPYSEPQSKLAHVY